MTSPIVIRETQTVVVTAPGPQGPPGSGSGGSFYFQHIQSAPSASWVCDHNLGLYPNVQVIIDGFVIGTDIHHNTVDQVNIVFPTPMTGVAIFS